MIPSCIVKGYLCSNKNERLAYKRNTSFLVEDCAMQCILHRAGHYYKRGRASSSVFYEDGTGRCNRTGGSEGEAE
jgi:hypothetical protein